MPAKTTRAVVLLCIALAPPQRAFALNPALDMSQYAHSTWTIGDGSLNARVLSIAQTPDGYLWLGTEDGLLRFDGVRFSRWQPPGKDRLPNQTILTLLVGGDGRLWIGTQAGLASWKDGRLVTYPEFAGHVVGTLIEDSQGTVWVGTLAIPTAHLCAIRTAVECVSGENRLGIAVYSLHEDGGTLLVGAATGLWRWGRGEPSHYDAVPLTVYSDFLPMPNGTLLVATSDGLKRLIGGKLEAFPLAGIDGPYGVERLHRDRDGGLWIAAGRKGLVHIHNSRTDVFGVGDGLTGDIVTAVYEDREGSIWAASSEGLDRFREPPVTMISRRQGLPANTAHGILPTRDGSVWVGSPDGLTRWRDGQTTTYRIREGLPDVHVAALFQDSRDRVLASTAGGIVVFDGDRFARLLRADATRVIFNIVEDQAGHLWANELNAGLLEIAGDHVVRRIPWSALGHDDHATTIALDRGRQGLWLGFYKGGVAFIQGDAIRASYGTADGLGAGRVSEVRVNSDGTLWVATAGGLSRIKDKRITTLTSQGGLPCESVHWTLPDADRSLWLLTACGLVRIRAPELAQWEADSSHVVTTTLFDTTDGVRTQSSPIGFSPTAARMTDGRLWFATPNGIGVVDPQHLPTNTVPPPVHIEQLVADRNPYDPAEFATRALALPPGVHDLQIDYTALSMVAPQKLRFRYMLEGIDRAWRDVGNRRQAFYTDLPPRKYRFRVVAANDSGVWNETGAAIDFSIAPAYYQTAWFMTLVGGLVLASIWGVHRLRLRIVETHDREIRALNERLMKAQEQERIRIAGELHDGVMQQMLAVTMMLGTAKRRISDHPDATAATIDKAQEKLIQAGTDIRHLSHELHPPVLQEAGLPRAVQVYCEEFSASSGIPVVCDVDQDVEDLSRGAALALFRIMQEALGNAAKHSSARQIIVSLRRRSGVVSLVIADDGVGFEPSEIGTGGSRGLGLVMMRERATQLNGTFEFDTAPGQGTTISTKIPFR